MGEQFMSTGQIVDNFVPTERSGRGGRIVGFFDITSRDEVYLKSRIAQHSGLIRVFIHPDFQEYSGFPDIKPKTAEVDRLRKTQEGFGRILSSSQDGPPIFVFESGNNPDEFRRKEERLSELVNQPVYVIRTHGANPNPLSPDRLSTYRWPLFGSAIDEESDQMWDLVRTEFSGWGIKKILIGGLEFYKATTEEGKEVYAGCLGSAIHRLADSFEIELSAMTWPDGRNRISNKAK